MAKYAHLPPWKRDLMVKRDLEKLQQDRLEREKAAAAAAARTPSFGKADLARKLRPALSDDKLQQAPQAQQAQQAQQQQETQAQVQVQLQSAPQAPQGQTEEVKSLKERMQMLLRQSVAGSAATAPASPAASADSANNPRARANTAGGNIWTATSQALHTARKETQQEVRVWPGGGE